MASIDLFLAEIRKSPKLQSKLMGCPSAESFVKEAQSIGIQLDINDVKQWQNQRIEELESSELDLTDLSTVSGGFSPLKLSTFSFSLKSKFLPGDMLMFLKMIG